MSDLNVAIFAGQPAGLTARLSGRVGVTKIWTGFISAAVFMCCKRPAFYSLSAQCCRYIVFVSVDEQTQTSILLQECTTVRDGLARLPDVFTAADMSDIVRYLCMC